MGLVSVHHRYHPLISLCCVFVWLVLLYEGLSLTCWTLVCLVHTGLVVQEYVARVKCEWHTLTWWEHEPDITETVLPVGGSFVCFLWDLVYLLCTVLSHEKMQPALSARFWMGLILDLEWLHVCRIQTPPPWGVCDGSLRQNMMVQSIGEPLVLCVILCRPYSSGTYVAGPEVASLVWRDWMYLWNGLYLSDSCMLLLSFLLVWILFMNTCYMIQHCIPVLLCIWCTFSCFHIQNRSLNSCVCVCVCLCCHTSVAVGL